MFQQTSGSLAPLWVRTRAACHGKRQVQTASTLTGPTPKNALGSSLGVKLAAPQTGRLMPDRDDTAETAQRAYLDNLSRSDRLSGGIRRIPVTTSYGTFRVWTKRFGNNPRIKLLLLHGGPGCTHEYFEPCDSYLPAAGIEYYYYDQLGSYYSDQPNIPELWDLPRFVDEVEQVRVALGLDASNFFLLGHSWGGILALEYALRHQRSLKGLVISNMMASIPAYNAYAERVLMPTMDPAILAEIKALEAAQDYQNPRYMA